MKIVEQLLNIEWITFRPFADLFDQCLREFDLFPVDLPELERNQLLYLLCRKIGQRDLGDRVKLGDAWSKMSIVFRWRVGDRDQDCELDTRPDDPFEQIMRERVEHVTLLQDEQQR